MRLQIWGGGTVSISSDFFCQLSPLTVTTGLRQIEFQAGAIPAS